MKISQRILMAAAALCVAAGMASAAGQKAGEKKILPAGPAFASVSFMDDEGVVKPVAQKATKPLKIAVIGMENNPFWIPVKEGAYKAAAELKDLNCTVDWIVPAGDAHTSDFFGNAIESAIVQKYDAIATIAGDSGIVPYINKAVEAGIPVATFNVETTTENKRLFFVGADLYKQGEDSAKIMAKELNNKGKVALLTGFFSVEGHEQRRLGFIETIAKVAPDIKIVGQVETLDKADVAYNQAKDFMSANPDLSAFMVCAGGAFGVGKAIEDSGKAGVIKLINYDFIDETMEQVASGVCTGTIGQGPFAQGHDPAIRLFNYLVAGQVPPAGRLLTKAEFVTKANLSKFWTKK
jgi:ABC-type sugar transport system substrate-binding protein